MLTELRIRNLAILDEVEMVLEPGFNVLTGETGAGKSIIVQAVHLLLGARGSEELIRSGAEEAVIEARFWVANNTQGNIWEEPAALPIDLEENEVLLRRTVARGGRTRGYVNDQAVTMKTLAAVGRKFLSLSGQHEYQTFLAPGHHLAILDAYGGLGGELKDFQQVYQEWRQLQRQWQTLRARQQQQEAHRELAAFQLQELEQAHLRAVEDDDLLRERERLRHASQLWEAAHQAYGLLYAEKGAVLERLAELKKSLHLIARLEAGWQPRITELESAVLQLEDLAMALRDYSFQVNLDPGRLQEVEQRLDILTRLKRKYGPTLAEALALRERLRQELSGLEELQAEKHLLEEKLDRLARKVADRAQALSGRRRDVAPRLVAAVEQELGQLAMPQARFSINFADATLAATEVGESSFLLLTDASQPVTARGSDQVEFFLAPNPGEPPKPLTRIASGGELSRLVLGLKNILAQEAAADTMVFDEVDAGIGGGSVANIIGQKLIRLAQRSQVICITHLPQIACYAQCHFRVEKHIQGDRTVTQVTKLTPEGRLHELARLLAGPGVTKAALTHARDLLDTAQRGN